MSKDLSERVADLEAWVEVVMRTLATLGVENLLIELDKARRADDEEDERYVAWHAEYVRRPCGVTTRTASPLATEETGTEG
jgi:hypothetical protein